MYVCVVVADLSGNTVLEATFGEWAAAWLGFLFICIASSQCALIVRYVALPLITGYMFFGSDNAY